MVRVFLLAFLVLGFGLTCRQVRSHEESGEWSCESNSEEIRVQADFRAGVITLDGQADDWKYIDGSEFTLLPALDPHEDHVYKDGKMTVKALHDGNDVFFLLQVDGDYAFSQGNNNKCPSVALMFQIGDDATYHNMGGCKEQIGSCTHKNCKGHEVDIMQFSIGNAIPGRLYGGGDRFDHLVDVYAWNPHCRYLDGMDPSGNVSSTEQNNWKGAWWHSSFKVHSGFVEEDSPYSTGGEKGTYYFEFSRPLRTMDRLQQDVEFTIGASSKMSVAFWYPVDGNPWAGYGHYTIHCDWVSMDIIGSELLLNKSWDLSTAFALVLSVAALCIAIFVAYRHHVSTRNSIPFTAIGNL